MVCVHLAEYQRVIFITEAMRHSAALASRKYPIRVLDHSARAFRVDYAFRGRLYGEYDECCGVKGKQSAIKSVSSGS